MAETILPSNFYKDDFDMSPEEKFNNITNLKTKLEENFMLLGQLLQNVKKTKLYKLKGYKSFKDFVEKEYQMTSGFANKLIKIQDIFVDELQIDEMSLKNIGFDKLNLVRPMINNSEDEEEKSDWVNKAESLDTTELREEIKEIREHQKNREKTLKDAYVEQYMDKMTGFLGCSAKELNFKMALYFQDKNLEELNKIIKQKEIEFNENLEQ